MIPETRLSPGTTTTVLLVVALSCAMIGPAILLAAYHAVYGPQTYADARARLDAASRALSAQVQRSDRAMLEQAGKDAR